ncbi:Ser-Thr-rich GPI-anchored membrane family protein [Dapis sp. BLCC M172]|uniref:Ser-Thr-rich GPI-anchored membrane family protein n=1 Tax=Dapis sp. BLCC M172 TaxID=2975281 RepID=UPI003CF3B737
MGLNQSEESLDQNDTPIRKANNVTVDPLTGGTSNQGEIRRKSSTSRRSVNITSPSSSSRLEPGRNYNIRWTDNCSDNVRLDLYKGNSFQQTISRSTRSDGSHPWRVPTWLSSGNNYRVRIRNVNDSSVSDFSSNFRIETDEVSITSPSSSSRLEPGRNYNIRWTDNCSDNVRLDLYKGNSFQQTISRSTRSDGSHPWRVPTWLSSGKNYRIRIRNVNDSSVSDFSSNFRIESQTTWPPRNVDNLGTYTGRKEERDYVSRGNHDYYRFSVNSPGNLQFALRGLRADANV